MNFMKNTEKYFYGVAGFIEDMQEISAAYDRACKRLEAFKGSTGYTVEMQKAQADRDAAVQKMRETYLKQFRDVVAKMREAIDRSPLTPPTPEQAALLSILQMRESLDADELKRAAQQMAGCPAALAVLDDLAQKHKITGKFNQEMSAADLHKKADTLEQAALSLIQEGAGAASRPMPKDVVSCLDRYGSFNRVRKAGIPAWAEMTSENMTMDVETIQKFCAAVDG